MCLSVNFPSIFVGIRNLRDLKCHFDRQNNDKLICSWTKPENANGRIQLYYVWVKINEDIIYTYETTTNNFEWDHALQDGGTYTLGVNAKGKKWSETATATFQYTKSGEAILILSMCDINILDILS